MRDGIRRPEGWDQRVCSAKRNRTRKVTRERGETEVRHYRRTRCTLPSQGRWRAPGGAATAGAVSGRAAASAWAVAPLPEGSLRGQ